MKKIQVNEALFAFLKAIYKFEQMELKEFSISWQEMLLLKHLRIHQDMSMGSLTNILEIKPFQGTRLVDGLVKKQLVERFEKESDKRIKSIRITKEGSVRMTKVDHFHELVIERAAEDLGMQRTDELLEMMFQLEKLLGLTEN